MAGSPDSNRMPPPAPCPMPVQWLDRKPANRPGRDGARYRLHRALVLGTVIALAGGLTLILATGLAASGWTVGKAALLLIFAVTTAWVGLAFVTSLAGLLVMIFPRLGYGEIQVPDAFVSGKPRRPAGRTAVLVPIYGEKMEILAEQLRALLEDLAALNLPGAFDVVVLSDSQDVPTIAAERAALSRLAAGSGGVPLYHRHRLGNAGRKAGNVAQWCQRWGGAYDFMLVLDADSVMSAATLLRLVLAMEAHPEAGLMQTVPRLLPGRTLFGRIQSFSALLYAPLIGHGLAFWHGPSSNYWGHNAILRTQAFCAAAGLPRLPGRAPLGGEILSHDFVEAALLRRAGWKVYLLPDLDGSWEDAPQTLLDYALRDRRWCQGNLQHARVLPARGLHWMSRLHLATGIMNYAAAPCWVAMLLAAAAGTTVGAGHAAWLIASLATLLLGTKLCGVLSLPVRPDLRGRRLAVIASALVETVLVALLAPLHMVAQTRAVIDVLLLRRHSGWRPQRRGDGLPPPRAQFLYHLPYVPIAAAAAALFYASGALTYWVAPVLLVLGCAPLLAVAASSRRLGSLAVRFGLFPSEIRSAPAMGTAQTSEPQIELREGGAEPELPPRAAAPLRKAV